MTAPLVHGAVHGRLPGRGARAGRILAAWLLLLLAAAGSSGGAAPATAPPGGTAPDSICPREEPFVIRPFRAADGAPWIVPAIAYGPHRDGQRPGGPAPTREQLREDLHLMSKHWRLLRVYGSTGPSETMLDVIRQDRLPLNVMLGVWIQPEDRRDSTGAVLERLPEAATANRAEVESAVRLAAAFPELVIAVSVGNETQIFWSAHRVPGPLLERYIREVRARTSVPVTTADDFNFWNKSESRGLAEELDFIVTHLHPLWNGQLSGIAAVDWTRRNYAEVRAAHPGRTVVIGETGWATRKLSTGEQGRLMKGEAGEAQQALFCRELAAWAVREQVPTFFFEAFDENWKGGTEADHAEKHWGFFRADRMPKLVLRSGEEAAE